MLEYLARARRFPPYFKLNIAYSTAKPRPIKHKPNMSTTKLKLTSLESLGQAAECLRVLAHPHRLRMLQMLHSATVYGYRTGPSLRDPHPHGLRTPSAHATMRIPSQQTRRQKGLLRGHRTPPEKYPSVHRRPLRCQKVNHRQIHYRPKSFQSFLYPQDHLRCPTRPSLRSNFLN